MDRSAAIKLLLDLCDLAQTEVPDYDSARQIGWAFEIIHGELYSDPQSRPTNHQKIEDLVKELNKEVRLDLPSGADKSIEKELPESLRQVYCYDPNRFQKTLSKLMQELPAK